MKIRAEPQGSVSFTPNCAGVTVYYNSQQYLLKGGETACALPRK